MVVGDALEHPHAGQAHGRVVAAQQLGGAEHAGRRLPVVREPRLPGGDRRLRFTGPRLPVRDEAPPDGERKGDDRRDDQPVVPHIARRHVPNGGEQRHADQRRNRRGGHAREGAFAPQLLQNCPRRAHQPRRPPPPPPSIVCIAPLMYSLSPLHSQETSAATSSGSP